MSAALSDVTLKLMGVGHVFQIPVCSKSPCATLVTHRRQVTNHIRRLSSWPLLLQEHQRQKQRILQLLREAAASIGEFNCICSVILVVGLSTTEWRRWKFHA